jgi:fructosamine-3-kinase
MKQYIHSLYHGLCLYSLFVDHQIRQADAVHHIVPLREDWSRRVDIGNLIPLSVSAHSIIEQMYKQDKVKAQALCFDLLTQWTVGAVKMF